MYVYILVLFSSFSPQNALFIAVKVITNLIAFPIFLFKKNEIS